MMRTNTTIKEVCGHCQRHINIGQCVLECPNCDVIIHTKCHKKAKFKNINNSWLCQSCTPLVEHRYNPFSSWLITNSDGNKFYDEDDENDNIAVTISGIMNSCTAHSINSFRENVANKSDITKNSFSSLFLNIDGNQSNFNDFLIKIKHF